MVPFRLISREEQNELNQSAFETHLWYDKVPWFSQFIKHSPSPQSAITIIHIMKITLSKLLPLLVNTVKRLNPYARRRRLHIPNLCDIMIIAIFSCSLRGFVTFVLIMGKRADHGERRH